MSWFSKIKRAVSAPVRVGLAPIALTAKIARHPTAIRSHLRAGVAAGLMPLRMARATTSTALRFSPHALVVNKLRSAARRAPTTPIQRGGTTTAAAPWYAPPMGGGGGGGGGGAYASDDDDQSFDEDDSQDAGDDQDAGDQGDDDQISGMDYAAYLGDDDGPQLAGWTDDLAKIGVNLAKGAASGILSSAAGQVAQRAPLPPPPPPGMSTTAKLAIGAAVAIPFLFVLTRKRGGSAVAA
jgi:hypothetical protein